MLRLSSKKAELPTTASGTNTVSDIQESSDAGRGNAPRTFAAGVNGNNAADANSSENSIRSAEQKSQENFSAEEKLCAYCSCIVK